MRTGKTQQQVDNLRKLLQEGRVIHIGGMKDPTDYLNRLGEEYSAEESFRTTNINMNLEDTYFTGGEKIKTGYIFRKL